MVVTEKEPYEENLQTRIRWNLSKNKISTVFKRDHKSKIIVWESISELLADKIKLIDTTGFWRAEIQTMTEVRFHMHVESIETKNMILFSGILQKSGTLRQFLSFLF